MFNFDYITKEDIKKLNSNWPEIPDNLCKISIVGGSGSEKNCVTEPDINKVYLYVKDP